jgi:hypothetical protein
VFKPTGGAVAQSSHEGYASTVRVSDFDVELDGDFVRVLRDGVEVARCGWTGRRIAPPTAPRGVAPVIDWQAIEQALVEWIDADLESRRRAAYDDAGVDLTLVDYMLSLSPRERLDALLTHARSIGRLL